MPPTRVLLVSLLVCSPCTSTLLAQGRSGLTDPPAMALLEGQRRTGYPFGYPQVRSLRLLQIHDGLLQAPNRLTSLALRRDGEDSGPAAAFKAHCSLWLSTAATPASGIDPRFASNHGSDRAQVLDDQSIDLPAHLPQTGELPTFSYELPFAQAFTTAGKGPLCFELLVHDHSNTTALHFDLYAAEVPLAGVPEQDFCIPVEVQARASLQELDLALDTGWPQQPGLLFLGQPFPGPRHLPGLVCPVYSAPSYILPIVTDAQGAADLRFDIGGVQTRERFNLQFAIPTKDPEMGGFWISPGALFDSRPPRVAARVFSTVPTAAQGTAQAIFASPVRVR